MKKKNIAIIGAGQLGSRHLQALALLKEAAKIFVVDPSDESRETAKIRFEQIGGHEIHELKLCQSFEDIKVHQFDLVVVATNSAIRASIVKDFLKRFELSFLILEKFLFQKESDYLEVGELLKSRKIKSFVNCPRRMFPTYKKLKEEIGKPSQLAMEVIGNSWGLGCNGIHFVDLFHFLSGTEINHWNDQMDPGFIESKRAGYVEFTGRIEGGSHNGNVLSLTSYNFGKPNISVRISTPNMRYVIGEGLGKVWREAITPDSVDFTEYDYEMKFQSTLTNEVANELFKSGECELTPFSDSVKIHLPFLNLMLRHYNQHKNEKSDICPIT